MSHNIRHFDYPENVDRKAVLGKLSTFVSQATWQEGGHGIDKIRWLDSVPPLGSYEEAEEYICAHDNGWYDCLAVKYKSHSNLTQSGINALHVKIRELENKKNKLTDANYPSSRTSAFISCPSCSSKLSRTHLASMQKPNICPLCAADIRPDSVKMRDASAKKREKAKIEKEIEKCKKQITKLLDKDKTGNIRWLVKIEYHT